MASLRMSTAARLMRNHQISRNGNPLSPMRSGFTTWLAMCGNGCRIAILVVMTERLVTIMVMTERLMTVQRGRRETALTV
jgi:hypothetical protein